MTLVSLFPVSRAMIVRRVLVISCVLIAPAVHADSFRAKLGRETKIARPAGELREVVNSLARSQEITVQIDPRVDPRAVVTPPTGGRALLQLFDELAVQAGATARPLGESVLITPIADADRIATLAAIRQQELLDSPTSRRTLDLMRPIDLAPEIAPTTPIELLEIVRDRARISVESDDIGHDLWHVELRRVTTAEALAFVLVPMGYAYEWAGAGITLIPLPDRLAVSRSHRIPATVSNASRDAAIDAVLTSRDGRQVSVDQSVSVGVSRTTVSFLGTAAEHERFAALLRPTRKPRATDPSRKRYTLTVVDQPASVILASLQTQGLDFRYDTAALATGGVDLAERVSVSVQQATAQKLLETIAEQIGAVVSVEDGVLTLGVP